MTERREGLDGIELHYVDSVEKAGEFLRWLSERRPHDAVSVDIETGERTGGRREDALSPWHGQIRLAQVGDGMQGWAIPWDEWSGVFYQGMVPFEGQVVCHNIAFEAKWFSVQSRWKFPWHQAHDTMIMAHLIDPLGTGALKQLAAAYVDPLAVRLQSTLDEQLSANGWTWGTVPTHFQPYWCVPLDTEILTRSGWKKYSDLVDSDETLGYDTSTGTNRWTKITNVQTFTNAPLMTVGNSYWNTVCTPDHRWLYQMPAQTKGKFAGYGEVRIDPLVDIQNKRGARLLLAAKAEGGNSSLTSNEAAVLAWLLSDGTVHWQREKSSPIASIIQHPNKYADEIRDLLKHEDAYVSERFRGDCLSFYVRSGYVTDLWIKAGLWDQTYSDLVLSLSVEARRSWWDAWLKAEGTAKRGGGFRVITQNYGPKMDALVLTAYLEGHHVTVRDKDKSGKCGSISLGKRGVTFQKKRPVSAGSGDVWCPTTELGSWTARDSSGRVFVTGNCYGALDTILTMRLWEQFYEKCGPGKAYSLPYELEMATRRIVTHMEVNGARVDLDYSRKKYDELIAYTESVKEWARQTYGGVSITSTVQLARLFESLGGEITEYTPSGQKSLTKDQLKRFVIDGNPEVKHLAETVLAQRKADKLASSYFQNFLEKSIGGFVHPSVRTLGARTGRMSITDPALQTLPSGEATVRRAFIPRDEDHVIISSDLDQVEFRLTAALSEDPDLIGLFLEADRTGGDAFTSIMRDIYQDPTAQKSDPRRKLVKGTVYGKLYGAGPAKMALTAGVSEAQMREVVDAFDAAYPGVKRLQKNIENIGMQRLRAEGQGYVLTRTGRRLPCDDDRVYSLTNYLVQSSAAEIFKQNLIKLDQCDLTDYMIVPVHDEIVLQVPRSEVAEVMPLVQQCMTTTEGWAVPLTAGVDGPFENWGDRYA